MVNFRSEVYFYHILQHRLLSAIVAVKSELLLLLSWLSDIFACNLQKGLADLDDNIYGL